MNFIINCKNNISELDYGNVEMYNVRCINSGRCVLRRAASAVIFYDACDNRQRKRQAA